MLPEIRQGYLLVDPIENPWGEMVGAVDISPIIERAPGRWVVVVAVPKDRTNYTSEYKEGDAVYIPRQADPVTIGNITYALVHESAVKMVLRAGTFECRIKGEGHLTLNVMNELREQDSKAMRPRLAVTG